MRYAKTILLLLVLMLFIFTALIMSCNKSTERRVEAAQTDVNTTTRDGVNSAQQTTDQANADWLKFKTDSEATIAANDKIIADYKLRMTNAQGKYVANYDKQIDALETKNKALKVKLAEYKNDGQSNWQTFSSEFMRDLNGLGTSLKNFTTSD